VGKSDRAVFRVLGVVAVIVAVILVFLPISAASSDASHDCGTLMARHEQPLRRAFCEERRAYRNRVLWIGGVFVASGILLVAGRWRGTESMPDT
jgi:hypothetical protein